MIRLLIVDDDPLVRAGLSMMLAGLDDLRVVGEAADGIAAVRAVRSLSPDVVLMDVRMPEMDGVEATRLICAAGDATKVVVLTTFDLDEYLFATLRVGASGFLLKDCPPADLLRAIRVSASGEGLLAPALTRRVIREFAGSGGTRPQTRALDGVTAREHEVLVLIARGLSNDEIAARLHLSPATVKSHVRRLLAKLRARDRAQLVIAAYEAGAVTPSAG
ncbi:MAG TPA: response regulator transcription factor [Phytomonospora sp.]